MRYERTNPATRQEEIWYYVGVAVDPNAASDSSKAKHLLRTAAGQISHFSSADFQAEFRLSTAVTPSDSADAYRETLANIRHNSTVRFAVLPFFLTASAILANAYRTDSWKEDELVAWFGLGLAMLATVFEIALSRNLICWWKAIRPLSAADPWLAVKAHRSEWALWPVRYALFLPYLVAIYYWLSILHRPVQVIWGAVAIAVATSLYVWIRGSNVARYRG